MLTKKSYLYDIFLCQIEILLLNMLKLFKIPGFFFSKLSNSRLSGPVYNIELMVEYLLDPLILTQLVAAYFLTLDFFW